MNNKLRCCAPVGDLGSRTFGLLCCLLYFVSLSIVLAPPALAQASQAQPRHPVAIVAGQEIDQEDLRSLTQSKLISLQKQEYEIKRSALDQLIDRKLLEVEANKQ